MDARHLKKVNIYVLLLYCLSALMYVTFIVNRYPYAILLLTFPSYPQTNYEKRR